MDDRALIFSNLLNGVPVGQVCKTFNRTEPEVMQLFYFILRKIKSYVFLRQAPDARHFQPGSSLYGTMPAAYPTITASTIEEARKHRLTCLRVLPKINLDKAPQFKDIQTEIVTPDNAMQIARNLA